MDFRDSPEEAAFRERLRSWLAETAGRFPTSGDDYWRRQGEWHQALYSAGFFGLSWPEEHGGHELPPVYDVILDEELARAGAPPRPSLGYLMQGLGRHGSEELQRRFLPGMINGTERWCQGFSEPGAGSDLASLTTTAVREGDDADEYVVRGHKIWTSYSDVADWCLLLARTDPDAPLHKGLSGFIVWGPVLVTKYRLFVLVVTVLILVALWLFLQGTRYGRIIRAGSRDPEMVSMLGINLKRVFTAVFGLGTAVAGIAGVLAAPLWSVVPSMSEAAIMPAFVVVTIGGLGSFGGAVISGLLVGISVALSIQFWPAASTAVMYALMILVLLIRPRGLLGESWERFE